MPIVGTESLADKPSAQVVITDAEDAYNAARRLFPSLAVIFVDGRVQRTSWSCVARRQVVLMPSADRLDDARALAEAIVEAAETLKICEPEAERGPKWSIGFQADWGEEEALSWAKATAKPVERPAPEIILPPVEEVPLEDYEESSLMLDGTRGRPIETRERPKPRLATVDGDPANPADPTPDGGEAAPLPIALSDDAIAEHIASQHGRNWRYVKPWGRWYQWDGDGWREDQKDAAHRLCLEATREVAGWRSAQALSQDGKRKLNSRRTAGAIKDNLGAHPLCAASIEQWDKDPWLLGCPGGVLDLMAGKMIEPEQEQYITKRCAVAPKSGAPTLWLEFLKTVTAEDDSLIAYLQRFAGYALTGETAEHALVFLHGSGANGKTVFLHTLSGIMGDYAVAAGIETFTEQKQEHHSTEIARLRGARLVVTEETEQAGHWAEGRIKRLTGGGKIAAHFMRADDFEFTPQFKLLIAGNHKPALRSVDEAIRRRFHLVPFAVTIPQEQRDTQLFEKLRAEWSQILNWMVEGCLAWRDAGLGMPESIQEASAEYLKDEDTLIQWIDECCERDPAARSESSVAYRNYLTWCERSGEHSWSRKRWVNGLEERGFKRVRTATQRMISGFSLKLNEPPQGDSRMY